MPRCGIFIFLFLAFTLGNCTDSLNKKEKGVAKIQQEIDSVLSLFICRTQSLLVDDKLYLNMYLPETDFYSRGKLQVIRELALVKTRVYLKEVNKVVFFQMADTKRMNFTPENSTYTEDDFKDLIETISSKRLIYDFKFFLLRNFNGKELEELWNISGAIYRNENLNTTPPDFPALSMKMALEIMNGEKEGPYHQLMRKLRKWVVVKGLIQDFDPEKLDYFLEYNELPWQGKPYHFRSRSQE